MVHSGLENLDFFKHCSFGLDCLFCGLFSFPPVLPVTKDNMNYVCVVIVGYTAYSILYWKYKGKKEFHALEESENEQAEYSNNFDTIEDSREFSVAASDVELENEHVPWGKK